MVNEAGGYEPIINQAVIQPITLHEGHVKIGNDMPDIVGGKPLAATYSTNIKSWLSRPGREAYHLEWPEENGELPRGTQLGEKARNITVGGTRDEYLLADPADPTSVIGRFEPIRFPRVPNKESALAYLPAPDEPLFHPLEDPNNPYTLYEAGRHAMDIVLGEALSPDSEGDFTLNPTVHQTSGGIMIEFEYGRPKYLFTPMGQVEIGRNKDYSKSGDELVEELSQKGLQLDEYMPMQTTTGSFGGSFGPTYAVISVGEDTLPKPGLKSLEDYFPPDASENAWEEFGKRYAQSKTELAEGSE